ncbi:MAG: tRNA (N6-threonylcarbamoyladenosine(37)-N6)-methyltransferase TrmO [Clostridia bacterium]|nr:tRNA (N6-threonylcarbamoyladenosine(37)-N6)-methyltransferase TrmO [Clostridia bacterium]
MGEPSMKIIARIVSDYTDKFGIPRQSGLVPSEAKIIFEPEFRDPNALRGLEGWSHLWLIWQFSESIVERWSPTVRPPRLGGNTRVGVFATRSPFRPNPIGLSSVKLVRIADEEGLWRVLYVTGADLMNGTPIYDIKPYLPYTDSHPDATGGFAADVFDHRLDVKIPPALLCRLPEEKRGSLCEILAQDPRPSYKDDPTRVYGVKFAGFEVKFTVEGNRLEVILIERDGEV